MTTPSKAITEIAQALYIAIVLEGDQDIGVAEDGALMVNSGAVIETLNFYGLWNPENADGVLQTLADSTDLTVLTWRFGTPEPTARVYQPEPCACPQCAEQEADDAELDLTDAELEHLKLDYLNSIESLLTEIRDLLAERQPRPINVTVGAPARPAVRIIPAPR